jgi:hypothetical protein
LRTKKLFSFQIFLPIILILFCFLTLASCGGGGGSGGSSVSGGVVGASVSGEPATFRGAGVVNDPKYLIGGPLAQGRVGDVLLQNDKIRVIIQKPRRNSGVALYGGNIIDADITRAAGEPGQDNFGITFPLINVSWTPFYQRLEVLNGDFSKGPAIVRASGILNVYDYIQTSIIVPFARIAKGVTLFFPDQYNDVLNPFKNLPKLRNISMTVVTDYILREDRSYLIIQTHLQNNGSDSVPMPIGDWVNGSGTLETFVPGVGFTGQGLYNPTAGVPALIYPGMETNVGVSYGYFFDPTPFTKTDGTVNPTDLLTVSGVSIMGLGERVAPGIIPLGSSNPPTINFSLPPGETTYVRYFSVGNGDAGSVLSGGLQALGVPTYRLSGQVTDAQGQPVDKARVLVFDSSNKKTVAMFYSDSNGNFAGDVSTGVDSKAKMFGSGQYDIEVYKEGYMDPSTTWPIDPPDITKSQKYERLAGKNKAGHCNASGGVNHIQCKLGQSGLVQVSARDENGTAIPARIAVVGFDPSPYHGLPHVEDPNSYDDHSLLADIEFQGQQYGYMDTFFLNPAGQIANIGNPRFVNNNVFRLEPGDYEIFVMRGPEYSMFSQRITVANGGTAAVNATLRKVVNTSGYISGDFHIHGINSPDSPFGQQARVNFALAEGLDLMVSADHDVITDYSKAIGELGVQDYVTSIPGDEITPMAFGHFLVFPLLSDPSDPTGGAFDYTKKEGFDEGPDHHELLSPEETLTRIDQENPGEQVLQVNHIMDNLLGNFSLSRLVTSTKFEGVPALSTYSDPVQFRLSPNSNSGGGYNPPYPYGTNRMITDKFTSLEICIGESKVVPLPHVLETSLPTWFDLLNLGKVATATCSSDTHRQIREPIGILRNYVLSSVDPRDGKGSFSQVNPQEIAHNVNQHHVIVSAGPFVTVQATSPASSETANVGDTLTLSGTDPKEVDLQIHVESPDWMDWDTVEVYVNTDPTPAEDDLSGPWKGTAEEFVTPNKPHLNPKYIYSPTVSFKRGGGNGSDSLNQTIAKGVRSATLNKTMTLSEDSWIVVLVKGSDEAHTIFPYGPKAVNTKSSDVSPANFLSTLDAERSTEGSPDKIGGSKAFAFTNPIFVDVDGDGWQAKYMREGKSPLSTK